MTNDPRAAMAMLAVAVAGLSLSACGSSESGQTCTAPGPCYVGQEPIALGDDYSLALGAPQRVDPRALDGSIDDAVLIRADMAAEAASEAFALSAASYGSLASDDEFRLAVLLGEGASPTEIDVTQEFAASCDQATDGCTLVIVPEAMPADLEHMSIRIEYEGETIEVRQHQEED